MNTTSRRGFFAGLLAIALIATSLPALSSYAGTLHPDSVPTITLSVDSFPGGPWTYTPAADALEMASGQGRGKKLGMPVAFANILGNRAAVVIEDLEFDPDPFVVHNILITNTTASTQLFNLTTTLPTTFPAPNIISGAITTSIIDSSGDGTATVGTVGPGQPLYSAQIDGTTVATLQNHPFTLSVTPPPPLNSAMASFGPTGNAVPVTSDIGIQLRFSLSPGDTVAILSRFDVVPEPSSFGLGLLGMLAVVAARWRKR